MKRTVTLLFFTCLTGIYCSFAQTNFREGYEKSDPIAPTSTLQWAEKVKAHQQFLEKAIANKDSLKQLYAYLYLFVDYAKSQDFPKAAENLLKAETIAKSSGNAGWQGWVSTRRAILNSVLKDFGAAIVHFQNAADLCRAAGDSLCVAESLEQISSMHGQLGNFEKAEQFFKTAFPLIQKYGRENQLAATANNFGILLSKQNRPAEAIPYIQKAAETYRKLDNPRDEARAMNNLADANFHLKRYDQTISIYNKCIEINKQYNQLENLVSNYTNLNILYETIGDYKSANEYLKKYYELRDSIIGAKIKVQIAELEAKYANEQKELALQKTRSQLQQARLSVERRTGVLILLLLLIGFGFWRWRTQSKQNHRELTKNKATLKDMTRILLEKNTQLIDLEQQLSQNVQSKVLSSNPEGFEENLFNQRILTETDWASFKVYFENVYPGKLQRLRGIYVTLSEAEERLFLLIKCNLSTKEIAGILGISSDSVKRTRNRLRKRLEFGEETDLNEFIHAF